jgi:hypothetical protein
LTAFVDRPAHSLQSPRPRHVRATERRRELRRRAQPPKSDDGEIGSGGVDSTDGSEGENSKPNSAANAKADALEVAARAYLRLYSAAKQARAAK